MLLAAVAKQYTWRPPLVGPAPACACGCGGSVRKAGRQWRRYLKNHHRRRWLAQGLDARDAKAFERIYRVFGLTPAAYQLMLQQQGGCCAICRAGDVGDGFRLWCIDHDHATGKVRGLLCRACNSGLGQFRDNTDFMLAAVAYLRRLRCV